MLEIQYPTPDNFLGTITTVFGGEDYIQRAVEYSNDLCLDHDEFTVHGTEADVEQFWEMYVNGFPCHKTSSILGDSSTIQER
jgi:hypothetical protein